MSNNQEPFDLTNVEFKMPEENFLSPTEQQQPSRSLVWVLVLIIILLVLILGGLIWWGFEISKTPEQPIETIPTVTRPTPEENNEPESTNAEADVSTILTTSSSGDWPDIKADIEATDLNKPLSELTTIDNLFNTSAR